MSTPPPCVYHPQHPAAAPCVRCGHPFCANCLIQFQGQQLCGVCRNARLAELQAGQPYPLHPNEVYPIPRENWPAVVSVALGLSGFYYCLGVITGPTAIITGLVGLSAVRKDPKLPRRGAAITGIALGAVSTLISWGVVAAAIFGHR